MKTPILTKDDLFILGNIGARAILSGRGAETEKILSVLQAEQPNNAGSFLMQAVYMFSKRQVKEAIAFLEESPIFTADTNGDEAVAFFLVLLKEDGQLERARTLGDAILVNGLVESPSARHAILKVLDDIEESQSSQKKTVLT
jgi:hypothetical protein